MMTPPPVAPLSRHSSTVRMRLSASVRTPKPIPPNDRQIRKTMKLAHFLARLPTSIAMTESD
jgi:hypothetical protein